ncbi:hypothetical protein LO772_27425 [Yinghuangia sp. ASG 101]|uniref:hypothetical protein n=1 Tax=Yinghuangia sp. ASG 101 TaxID=2896848 RepID=UPI001E2EF44D|nr:hypothetical protein [Yinghuangia sp. ASG 101]UGQ10546.1 hypothetical protein LO772_27425 [Yinghuangia sp. ASG 101]
MAVHNPRHIAYPPGEPQSPLDMARTAFALLVTGPAPLAVDGRAFPHLPGRTIPLDELRDRLLLRRCPLETRDAAWAHLVTRSRTEGAAWTVACVGMALPALIPLGRWMADRYPGEPWDIHAEVLTGFLRGLASVDLDRPGIMVRLRWGAFRAGHAALYEALDAPTPIAPGFRSLPPPPPWGHPDLVLARAVRWGVVTRTEADLIGTTRLDQVPITDWAATQHTTTAAAYKARSRAERRLVAFLRDEVRDADADDPVASRVQADLAPATPSAARISLAHAARSRSVTPGRASALAATAGRVSNGALERGLSLRGGSTASARPTPVPEARRCA